MDDIRIGYPVYCGDQRVGEVARLVADASDSHVTDIVVDRGLLHGAKLLPLEDIRDVSAGRVALGITHDQFLKADGFVDQRFREPHDDWSAPPGYDPTHFLLDAEVAMGGTGGFGAGGKPGPFPPSPLDPRPNTLRPFIREGTPILSSNGTKVGEIRQASFNPEDGRLDSVLMKRGVLGQEHVDLPLTGSRVLTATGSCCASPRVRSTSSRRAPEAGPVALSSSRVGGVRARARSLRRWAR